MIAAGLAIVGLGDLILAQASPGTTYLFFILPFFAVGAGFVVGTCVRTAVIFASTPRRLPATAAALNQTSLVVGAQMGVAGVRRSSAPRRSHRSRRHCRLARTQQGDRGISQRSCWQSGHPSSARSSADLSAATSAQYGAAFAAGVQSAMTFVGIASLVAAGICWLAMSGPDPVNSIWELREEREQREATA